MSEDVLKDKYEVLKEADTDELTRFYRREALTPFLDKVILDSRNKQRVFSVAIADIDHFKKLNDKYGHQFGDEVLKYIASTLRLTLIDTGYIFRYGGDEFIIVFPYKEAETVVQLMRKCNHCVANRPFSYRGRLIIITISCGVASFPYNGGDEGKLIKKADEALYFSKHYGRNATTLARHLTYKRLHRFVFSVGGIFVVLLGLFVAGRYVAPDQFNYFLERFKRIKVIEEEPQDLDVIILKKGRIVKGYIVGEKKGMLEVSLELLRGEGTILIEKAEIKDIIYGSKQPDVQKHQAQE